MSAARSVPGNAELDYLTSREQGRLVCGTCGCPFTDHNEFGCKPHGRHEFRRAYAAANVIASHDATTPAGLDVERLAEAMASCEGVNWPKRWRGNGSHDFAWVARQVAGRYARLQSEAPA